MFVKISFKKSKKLQGFTLIEVLVSLSIFSVVTIMAVQMFSVAIQAEQRSAANRALQQNASFLMEFIGKEVRNGFIDYAGYAADGPSLDDLPVQNLRLVYRGTQTLDESIYRTGGNTPAAMIRKENPAGGYFAARPLTSNDVVVSAMNFYVYPQTECVPGDCDGQQTVTVFLSLRPNPTRYPNQTNLRLDLQSTFTSRYYGF